MSVDICFTSRNLFMKKEVLGPIERFNTLYIHVYDHGNNQVSNTGLSFKSFSTIRFPIPVCLSSRFLFLSYSFVRHGQVCVVVAGKNVDNHCSILFMNNVDHQLLILLMNNIKIEFKRCQRMHIFSS